jgi:FMN phosphatase YigB (HAD superfamily)
MDDKSLVCFDFDQTIVNGHFHAALSNLGFTQIASKNGVIADGKPINESTKLNYDYDNKGVADAAKSLLESGDGFKNKEKLKETFDTFFEQGHNIAITSFTKYPDVIKPTLKELGLTDDQLSKVHVVGGFPSDGANSINGKKEHIDAAMEKFGVKDYSKVMLIDDSGRNIAAAEKIGIQTIQVPGEMDPDPRYLEEAISKGNTLKTGEVSKASSIDNPVTKERDGTAYIDVASPKIEAAETLIIDNTPTRARKGTVYENDLPSKTQAKTPKHELYDYIPSVDTELNKASSIENPATRKRSGTVYEDDLPPKAETINPPSSKQAPLERINEFLKNSGQKLEQFASKMKESLFKSDFVKNAGQRFERFGNIIKGSLFKKEDNLEAKSNEKAPKENDKPLPHTKRSATVIISQLDDKTKEEIRGAATKGVEIDSNQRNDKIKPSVAINSQVEEISRSR